MRRVFVTAVAIVAGLGCPADEGMQPTPDYSLSLAPAALTIAQNGSGNATVNITRTNFTGAVTLSLSGAPAGVTGVFAPVAASDASAALTVNVGPTVVAAAYPITVNGTGTPGNRSTPLVLTVTATGAFTLAVAPNTLTLLPGASGNATVTITRDNFAGPVTLSLANAPAGVSGAFTPSSPTGTSSALVVNVGLTAPSTYALQVNGTGSPGTQQSALTLTVQNPCTILTPLPADTTVNGSLSIYDCRFGGPFFTDFYGVTLGAQAGLQVSMTASYDTYMEQYHQTGPFIAVNDDMDSTSLNSRIAIIAAPGAWVFAASSFDSVVTGSYALTVAPRAQTLTGCRGEPFRTWITRGVTITDQAEATDCTTIRAGGGRAFSDRVLITLSAAAPLSATVTSAAFNPRLELYQQTQAGPTLVASANGTGTSVTLAHTPAQTAVFRLEITTVDTVQTGAYTLNVTGPAPNVSQPIVLPFGPIERAMPRVSRGKAAPN